MVVSGNGLKYQETIGSSYTHNNIMVFFFTFGSHRAPKSNCHNSISLQEKTGCNLTNKLHGCIKDGLLLQFVKNIRQSMALISSTMTVLKQTHKPLLFVPVLTFPTGWYVMLMYDLSASSRP
jgi:hypothetical protein